jgi:hypothetical protein
MLLLPTTVLLVNATRDCVADTRSWWRAKEEESIRRFRMSGEKRRDAKVSGSVCTFAVHSIVSMPFCSDVVVELWASVFLLFLASVLLLAVNFAEGGLDFGDLGSGDFRASASVILLLSSIGTWPRGWGKGEGQDWV